MTIRAGNDFLTFVDNNVDMTTGTIKLKGTFPTDRKLWPGQFVRVNLRLTTQSNALVVPKLAVQTGQFMNSCLSSNRTALWNRARPTGVRSDQALVDKA
jgi:multidrug efflux system membrane fusion protein